MKTIFGIVTVLFAGLATPTDAQAQCSSLSFDRSNDFVTIPYSATFPTATFTAAAWIKTQRPQRRATFMSRGEDNITGNSSWTLYVQNDGHFELMLEDAADANAVYSSGVDVADDRWRHLAATRDSSGTVTLYINGQQVAVHSQTIVPSPNNDQDLTLGCTYGIFGPPPPPPRLSWFFGGSLDDPAMWNRALSGTEVQALYSSGVAAVPSGLVGHWNLDEGSGQAIADSSPAGNHGFLGSTTGSDSNDPQWLPHQIPSYTAVGTGCPGSAGTPSLAPETDSVAAIGSVLRVAVSDIPSGAMVIGVTGLSSTVYLSYSLPLEFDFWGMPGCFLRTNIRSIHPATTSGNLARWEIMIPNDLGLLGLEFYQQAFVVDRPANLLGATFSNASRATIGCQ